MFQVKSYKRQCLIKFTNYLPQAKFVLVNDWNPITFQLLAQQSIGQILQGYREGNINFAPTYKFDLATNSYTTA